MRLCRNAGSCRRAAFKASINMNRNSNLSPITRNDHGGLGLYRVCGPTGSPWCVDGPPRADGTIGKGPRPFGTDPEGQCSE